MLTISPSHSQKTLMVLRYVGTNQEFQKWLARNKDSLKHIEEKIKTRLAERA